MLTFSLMLICFFISNETIIKNKRLANFREKRRRKSVRKSQNASFSVEISNILNWKQLQKLLFHFNEINSFRNSQINVTFNCLLTTKSFKKTHKSVCELKIKVWPLLKIMYEPEQFLSRSLIGWMHVIYCT